MLTFRRGVPTRLRPVARRVQRVTHRLTGKTTPATKPTESGVPGELGTDAVLRLLYGPDLSEHTNLQARGILNGESIRDLSSVRRLLGALDRQLSPSPVVARFRKCDVKWVEIDGLSFATDTADASVSRQIGDNGLWEPHLTAVFERFVRPGDHVVDVGANIGYFTAVAGRLVGPTGRVTAIEPNSENCRLIVATAARNGLHNIDLLPVALDAQRGWAYFSTHIGSNGGMRPADIDAVIDGAGLIVPTFELDQLVTRQVDFLKIDVEGAEHRVLAGARRILREDRPIVSSEFGIEMIERVSGIAARDYLDQFVEAGYRLHIIDRTDGSLRPFTSPDALLADWPSIVHLEDLLLVPAERGPTVAAVGRES